MKPSPAYVQRENKLSLSLYLYISLSPFFLSYIQTHTYTHTPVPTHSCFWGMISRWSHGTELHRKQPQGVSSESPHLLILGAPVWPFSLSTPDAPWLSSLSPLSRSLRFGLSLPNVYPYGSCNPKVQPNHQAPIRLKVLPFSIHTFTCWLDTPRGHSEPDTILNIGGCSNQSREFQKNIYFCFIDYAKAFDCVDHNKLWKILKEMGIPDHLTCLLRNPYAGQEATVRTGHGTTGWFQIGRGVHQGCILSPCLLNLYAVCIRRNAGLDEAQAGIKIAGRNINNLRYADDTTHMAESEEELKTLLMKVKEEREKVGLKLNIHKTKIMASGPITSWQIDGETMETVRDYFGGLQNHCRWCLQPWN